MMKNNGITLVALVVTVVVLLILAGVSINLVIGNNGIIIKAQNSKTKYEQAAKNDEIAMNSVYDEIINYSSVDNSGNSVTIKVGENNVTLTKETFGDYLGKVVTNYKTPGSTETVTIVSNNYTVSTTYRLYYIDFENKFGDGTGTIYLKADGTSNYYTVPTTDTSLDTNANIKIRNLNPHLYKDIEGNTITPPASTNNNMKQITWLTNTTNWEGLKPADAAIASKVNYVVGAPSLEMMMDSFNTHYKLTGDTPDYSTRTESSARTKLFYKYTAGANGYEVEPSSNKEYKISTSNYTIQADSSIGQMYYPNYNNYWLASPSVAPSYGVFRVYGYSDGAILSNYPSSADFVFCPLVSLKSSAFLEVPD